VEDRNQTGAVSGKNRPGLYLKAKTGTGRVFY